VALQIVTTPGIAETTETDYRIADSEISVVNYKVLSIALSNKVQGTTRLIKEVIGLTKLYSLQNHMYFI